MTLKDVVHLIKASVGGGDYVDDTTPADEVVADWVLAARSKLIRQLYASRKSIQDLIMPFCIAMEITDGSLCCGVTLNCDVLRSVEKLPLTLITGERTNGLFLVTSLDGVTGTKYDLIGLGSASLNVKSKFKSNLAFIQADYLYLLPAKLHPGTIDKVIVWVIPEDPIAWYDTSVCADGNCGDPWDREYIPAHYIHDLIRMIYADHVSFFKQLPPDTINNAKAGGA